MAAYLPNGSQAIVESEKLTGYCLNMSHPRGRHKARVFREALGIDMQHADTLEDALARAAAESNNAQVIDRDRFGTRYRIDFSMEGPAGTCIVRSGWVIRAGETRPRFTTCFVLR